jgi:EREBP-like factor
MCGGSILSGFIRPSGAAAAAKKRQQSRRVTADVLWPGIGRKAGEKDFEADFREFERGLREDDVDASAGDQDDEVQEVPLPAPEWFIFGGACKAAPVVSRSTVGENRIKAATFLFCSLLVAYSI